MILTLICWLLDRYVLPAGTLAKIRSAAEVLFQGMYKKALLFTVFILLSLVTKAQDQTLEYDVTHKGEHVGSMKLHQKKFGDNISINIESAVSMRFVFNINVFTEEASIFKNGRLVYSRVYRNVNGKENSNKQTTAKGDIYLTSSGGKKNGSNNALIEYNLHLLYSVEPVNNRRVYSDYFQQFLQIEKVAAHQYKISLPDGNYNKYFFENGTCSKVDVHHSLYSVQIRRKK